MTHKFVIDFFKLIYFISSLLALTDLFFTNEGLDYFLIFIVISRRTWRGQGHKNYSLNEFCVQGTLSFHLWNDHFLSSLGNPCHGLRHKFELNVLELMYSLGSYTRSVQNKSLSWKRKEVFIWMPQANEVIFFCQKWKSIDFICIDRAWAQFENM